MRKRKGTEWRPVCEVSGEPGGSDEVEQWELCSPGVSVGGDEGDPKTKGRCVRFVELHAGGLLINIVQSRVEKSVQREAHRMEANWQEGTNRYVDSIEV